MLGVREGQEASLALSFSGCLLTAAPPRPPPRPPCTLSTSLADLLPVAEQLVQHGPLSWVPCPALCLCYRPPLWPHGPIPGPALSCKQPLYSSVTAAGPHTWGGGDRVWRQMAQGLAQREGSEGRAGPPGTSEQTQALPTGAARTWSLLLPRSGHPPSTGAKGPGAWAKHGRPAPRGPSHATYEAAGALPTTWGTEPGARSHGARLCA